jgi:hypothetical protein
LFHRLEERVKAHVLTCMLACHLRRTWSPLTFTGQNPPEQDNPVVPARLSAAAQSKALYQHDPAGQPYRSFRSVLDHPGHLDPQPGPVHRHLVTISVLAEPASTQRKAGSITVNFQPLLARRHPLRDHRAARKR